VLISVIIINGKEFVSRIDNSFSIDSNNLIFASGRGHLKTCTAFLKENKMLVNAYYSLRGSGG
jgi:hypothetical protein